MTTHSDMIPNGWHQKKLGELLEIKHGFAFKSTHFNDVEVGHKLLTPAHFFEEGGFRTLEEKQKYYDGPVPNGYLLPKGALLVAMTEQAPGLLGSPIIVPEGGVYLHNQRLGLIVIKSPPQVSAPYLFHVFNVLDVRKQISTASGGTKVKHSSPEKIKTVLWRFPPLGEQNNIVKILSQWDCTINLTDRLIAEKRLRHKGLMQQLLTGKRRLPGFAGEWRKVRLGDIFRNRTESGRTDLPLVSIAADRGVIPRDEIDRKDSSSEDKSKYLHICPGDIGYNTMRMWQGVSGLSSVEGIVSPAYTIVIPRVGIDGEFMAILFKFQPVVHLFYRHSQGMVSDTWNLKFRHFAKIKVTIPDEDEQKAIARVFRGIDRELELLQTKANALREQKKGLMQQLLTGKKRVKL